MNNETFMAPMDLQLASLVSPELMERFAKVRSRIVIHLKRNLSLQFQDGLNRSELRFGCKVVTAHYYLLLFSISAPVKSRL